MQTVATSAFTAIRDFDSIDLLAQDDEVINLYSDLVLYAVNTGKIYADPRDGDVHFRLYDYDLDNEAVLIEALTAKTSNFYRVQRKRGKVSVYHVSKYVDYKQTRYPEAGDLLALVH
jgi:hypothetical protein